MKTVVKIITGMCFFQMVVKLSPLGVLASNVKFVPLLVYRMQGV